MTPLGIEPATFRLVEVTNITIENLNDIGINSSLISDFRGLIMIAPAPVAARSKAWVCGRSISEIVGSKPTRGMDVCLLRVLCVVR